MARVGELEIAFTGGEAAGLSIDSLASALVLAGGDPGGLLADFADLFTRAGDGGLVSREDGPPLVIVEPMDRATARAGELQGFEILPGDRYLELAGAVARHTDANIVLRHGWPILSVGSTPPTVAEAGDAASIPGGGAA